MKIISKTIKLLPLFLLVLGAYSCSDDDDNNGPGVQSTTVVDVAVENGLTSLATALTVTGLVDDLQQAGPFTVFAPSNAAFTQLINDTGLDLNNLSTAEEELVRNILLNHVIVGDNISSSELVAAGSGYVTNMSPGPNNTNLSTYFNVSGSVVEINGGASADGGANVVTADLEATNGVVHVVNSVIDIPTIVTFATADSNFSTLVNALTTLTPSTDFVATLSTQNGTSPAPFTVFAPTNDAFAALSSIPGESDLIPILQHHVIAETNAASSTLSDGMMAETLEGDNITINLPGNDGNPAKITDGSGNTDIDIIAVDVQASNGVIHAIESVLIPDTTN